MAVKLCGRCQTNFECKANQVESCQCSTIKLEQSTTDFLKQSNYDCLCNKCLLELNTLVRIANQSELPKFSSQFEQNKHFYIENGFYVFTEFYLIQRGYCCESKCRHCPYGY